MRNGVKIFSIVIINALLSACGQSGPLYMPGQATGVHKKDEFLLDSYNAPKPAAKESAQDKKPAAKATQTTAPPAAATPEPSKTQQAEKPVD